MFQTKVVEKNLNTRFMLKNFFFLIFENPAVYENVEQILCSQAGHRRQHGACALYTGYLTLQTHTQNM